MPLHRLPRATHARTCSRWVLSLSVLSLLANAVAQYPGSVPPPPNAKPGFEAVTIADAKRILGYLAGPETEGRGTGQPGYDKAAAFMAKEFQKAGLKPIGDNGTYFQQVPFTGARINPESISLTSVGSGVTLRSNQISLSSGPEKFDKSLGAILIRYKGSAVRLPEDAPVEGRLVIFVGDVPNGRLASAAIRLGAAAALTATQNFRPSTWRLRVGDEPPRISDTVTGTIAKAALVDWVGASRASESPTEAVLIESIGNVKLTAEREVKKVGVPNVVGLLEGSDPTLKAEYVGIGAHLDHLGRDGDTVYPGADDDGSGSTALALVAHAFAKNPVKPKRSVLFMAFCGEEMGLLGSAYLSNNSPVPLDKMVAELQMDMVGRDSDGVQNGDRNRVDKASENTDTMRLVGSKRISTELHDIILDLNKHVNFRFKYDAEDVYTRSDHYNFARKGIPIAFFFDGFHPEYHQPTDTIEKINFMKLVTTAKLNFLVTLELANRPTAPKKDVKQG